MDSGNIKLVYKKNSRYHNIKVMERGNYRFLLTDEGRARKQSCVNLCDLREHALDYSKLFFSSLLFVPEPRRALVVGLGAGVVPREMIHHVPGVSVEVIEIDPEIIRVAKRFFAFREGPRVSVIQGDGRDVIRRMCGDNVAPYDIIILDAFRDDYIPGHLMTMEFLGMVKKIALDSGVVAANMFNTNTLFPSQIRTFMKIFGNRLYALNGTRAPGTTIIFAPGGPASVPDENLFDPAQIGRRFKLAFTPEIPGRVTLEEKTMCCGVLSDEGDGI